MSQGPRDHWPAVPEPSLGYEVLLCESFEDVIGGIGTATRVADLAAVALAAGRVLLQARAGTGKSVTLSRAAMAAESTGVRVGMTSAVTWTQLVADPDEPVGPADLVGAIHEATLTLSPSVLGDDVPVVLFIDGLDEVETRSAVAILAASELLASRHPNLGVVVSDRLVRRDVGATWQLATLSTVPQQRALEFLGQGMDQGWPSGVLRVPLLLNLASEVDVAGLNYAALIRSALSGLDGQEIERLSLAVATGYAENSDRSVDLTRLSATIGQDLSDKLIAAHILVATGREHEAAFVHRLVADVLAASAIAVDSSRWVADEFDALTFNASSFDALALVLSEAPEDGVDLLLRRVYDWNVYAAAYMLTEDSRGDSRVSREMRVAISCMLAERQLDRVLATAQQAADALQLYPDSPAHGLLGATSLEEILGVAASQESTVEWFGRWQAMFTRPAGAGAEDSDIDALSDPDGVIGWTASNVLRRSHLHHGQHTLLEQRLVDPSPTVRWRTVHVLGSRAADEVTPNLLGLLRDDPDRWVRYGALRSLLEVAAGTEIERRDKIFIELAGLGDQIANTTELAREAERALFIRQPPHDWAESAGLLIEALWAHSTSSTQQDRWRSVSARLRLGQDVLR